MGFTLIHNQGAAPIGALLTDHGARISARKIGLRSKAGVAECFIKIELGIAVAKAIGLHLAKQKVHVLFGEDVDSGKLAISPDNESGLFWAKKRERDGAFLVTINQLSAAAVPKLRLNFEAFGVEKVEILSLPGMSKKAIIDAKPAFA